MKIGFYILGKKGYIVLDDFLKTFGSSVVAFIIGARDSGVEDDYFQQIRELCTINSLCFFERTDFDKNVIPFSNYTYAIGWRWIIDDSKNLIVFHDSPLPKYRGFAPLVNMLINGESRLAVTALFANSGYDKGDIIKQAAIQISYPIKISDAINSIVPLYVNLVTQISLIIYQGKNLTSTPQDESLASYSLWRDDVDYFINWTKKADEIHRFIYAVGPPYRGAAAYINNMLVRILDAELVDDVVIEGREGAIGKNIFMEAGQPVVVCRVGLLKITKFYTDDGVSLNGKVLFRSRFESSLR
ncbi:MAG: formyltransferase family protein [Methylotenera sp.]|nr:formyltransferase family protein [Methylotenera sp.]